MILVQKSLTWEPLIEKDVGGQISGFEIVGIKMKESTGDRYIIGVYRKPGRKENRSTWEKSLENKKKGKVWLIRDDFNDYSIL